MQEEVIKDKKINRFFNKFVQSTLFYGFYIVFVIVYIVFSILSKYFFTISNFNTILLHSTPLVIIAAGVTFVIISGNLDISIGSIAYLSTIVGVFTSLKFGLNAFFTIMIILAVATFCGFINGLLIAKLGISSFIVTMGMMFTLRGIGLFISRGNQLEPQMAIQKFGSSLIGPINVEVIAGLFILILAQVFLSKTSFGKYVFAVGCNEKAADGIGIKVSFVRLIIFTISGFFAGLSGIFLIGQIGVIAPTMNSGIEFVAIAAIVIGGTSLYGGRGNLIPGTLFGAMLLVLIENGLNYLGVSSYAYPFVRGLIIFTAMFVDSFKYRLSKPMRRI